jgi:hypothetical protein
MKPIDDRGLVGPPFAGNRPTIANRLLDRDARHYFLGFASIPGARPGLICSGVRAGSSLGTGSDCVIARSVVVAGMHPGPQQKSRGCLEFGWAGLRPD